MNKKEKQVLVLKELRKELGGKCGNACPGEIAMKLFNLPYNNGGCYGGEKVWGTAECDKYFKFLTHKKFINCPCRYGISSEIILLRLDEVIEELEEKEGKNE